MDFIKKELEKINEEKKRCASLYSDWKDDKYNCGPNKFVWGITDKEEIAESFEDLTILIIYYNRDTKNYFLQLDLEKIKDLGKLKLLMLFWLSDMPEGIGLAEYFNAMDKSTLNDGIPFMASNLSELYLQFSIFVNGYLDMKEIMKR